MSFGRKIGGKDSVSDSTLMTVQQEWTVDQEFIDSTSKQVDLMKILNKALHVSGMHDQRLQLELDTHFIEEDQAWVITQYEINIFDEVRLGDTIQIDTRLIEVNKFLCIRRYGVMRQGKLVCEIFGKFAAIDMKRRRIVRINLAPLVSANIVDTNYEVKFTKLTPFSTELNEGVLPIEIIDQDIDENLHVNNLSYFRWAYQSLPKEVVDKYQAVKIEVKYEKELLPQDKVGLTSDLKINDEQTSQHLIWNQSTEQLACILNIKWRER